MTSILMAATATPGHVYPLLDIGEYLVSRGHTLHFLTGSLFQDAVEKRGIHFTPFDPAVDFDYRNLHENFPDRDLMPPDDEQMALALREYFAGAVPVLDQCVRRFIAQHQTDLVLIENTFYGLLPLLGEPSSQRPPVLCVGVTPLSYSSIDSVFYGPRIPPQVRPAHLTREQWIGPHTIRLIEEVDDSFNNALAAHGYPPMPASFSDAMVLGVDHFLQLSTKAFEYARDDLPAHVQFVGPLRDRQTPTSTGNHAIGDDHPIVLVTQGTLANVDLEQLIAPAIRAFADQPVHVLIALGGRPADALPAALPGNVHVIDFTDFAYWLARATVLISNGGYGSVHKALARGVPLIVAGTGEDKKEAATRVDWAGCGINLRTGYATPEALLHALNKILDNELYRWRAAVIQKHFDTTDARDSIEQSVQCLAQSRLPTVAQHDPNRNGIHQREVLMD